jgi:hypothetical protein
MQLTVTLAIFSPEPSRIVFISSQDLCKNVSKEEKVYCKFESDVPGLYIYNSFPSAVYEE